MHLADGGKTGSSWRDSSSGIGRRVLKAKMHNLGWAPDLRDALSIPKSYGLIKGGVVCRVHLNILGSILAWYKASGRVR